jgi:hypothetical protein
MRDETIFEIMQQYMCSYADAVKLSKDRGYSRRFGLVEMCRHNGVVCTSCPAEPRKVPRPADLDYLWHWEKHPLKKNTEICWAEDGMELHRCTLCSESRRYDQDHDCGGPKLAVYLNGNRLTPDMPDDRNDYNIQVSDDIYLQVHCALRTGDVLLFDNSKGITLSHRIGCNWACHALIPLVFETDETIFKVLPHLKGLLPIGMDITPPYMGGCVIDDPKRIHTNVPLATKKDVDQFVQAVTDPDDYNICSDCGDFMVVGNHECAKQQDVETVNVGFAKQIATRATARIQKEHPEFTVKYSTINKGHGREYWIEIKVSECFGHIANFKFQTPHVADRDGEIDVAMRDRCSEVEDHVVKMVLGGLAKYE